MVPIGDEFCYAFFHYDHRCDAQIELAKSMEQAFRKNQTSVSMHSSS